MKAHRNEHAITHRKNRRRRSVRIILSIVSALIILSLAAVSAFALYVSVNIDTDIDLKIFENAGNDTVTRLYYFDADGQAHELDDRLYGSQVTVYTSLDRIPDNLIKAFVAIEDKRFYKHNGVDWYRTFAAGVNYFLKLRETFGASTITQQLIKNVTGSDDITVNRKMQEIFYAVDLENNLEKEDILEMYLNIVNLSQGCYGVGAAAEKYFSKPVGELSLAECAAIAAITKNPSYYDPINHPENNSDRRNVILSQMLEQGYINDEEFASAYGSELVLNVTRSTAAINSWYTDMVAEDVIRDLTEQLGYTRAAASYLVYNGGLRIYTAQNPEIQAVVEEYYGDESNFPSDDRKEGRSGIIIIDPADGDILGVAGSVGEKSGNRVQNYATDTKRPSGSSIKPLSVYAPGLEEGVLTWATVYDDVPVEFIPSGSGYTTWPNNANMTYRGLTNIRYAVQYSLNTVAIKSLDDVGIDTSYRYLTEKFNIDSLIEADKAPAPLALGQQTYGVTLREMTGAYTAFANGGVVSRPRSYVTVMTVNGDVLLDNTAQSERVISEGNAAVMTKLLGNVVSHGSTAAAVKLRRNIEVAGKTGTTQDSCDRWFIGYTPYYVCGVWYGHEYPSPLPSSTVTVCSETWNNVMTKIHSDFVKSGNVKRFKVPNSVISATFCCDSGKLMTGSCLLDPRGDRSETGWFLDGTQPKSFCECHITVPYDTENGGVASSECIAEECRQVGLIQVERSFPTQIYVTDAQYVWRYLPDSLPPSSEDGSPFFSAVLDEYEYCGISEAERQFNSGCPAHYNYSRWIFGSPRDDILP